MIMNKKNCGRAYLDASFHDFARIGVHMRYGAGSQHFICQYLIDGVKEKHPQLFDRRECHGRAQIVQQCLIVREYRSTGEFSAQNMLDRPLQALKCPLDTWRAIQKAHPVLAPRREGCRKRTEPVDQPLRQFGRARRTGERDQLFQGMSTPRRFIRLRCRKVAPMSMVCATQLHTASAST